MYRRNLSSGGKGVAIYFWYKQLHRLNPSSQLTLSVLDKWQRSTGDIDTCQPRLHWLIPNGGLNFLLVGKVRKKKKCAAIFPRLGGSGYYEFPPGKYILRSKNISDFYKLYLTCQPLNRFSSDILHYWIISLTKFSTFISQ